MSPRGHHVCTRRAGHRAPQARTVDGKSTTAGGNVSPHTEHEHSVLSIRVPSNESIHNDPMEREGLSA